MFLDHDGQFDCPLDLIDSNFNRVEIHREFSLPNLCSSSSSFPVIFNLLRSVNHLRVLSESFVAFDIHACAERRSGLAGSSTETA